MKCIKCDGELRVADKREAGNYARRRRICKECGEKYTYYEIPEAEYYVMREIVPSIRKVMEKYGTQIQCPKN